MTTSQTAAAEAAHSPGSRRTIPVSSVRIPHVCSPSMRLSALSRSPWLRSLDDSQLRALDATMTRRCWAAGEQLFRTGEDADALFVVAEGRVKLSQLRSDGSEAVTDIVGPGVLLGVIRTEGHRIQRETAEAGCENDGRPQAASARAFGHPAVRPAGRHPIECER